MTGQIDELEVFFKTKTLKIISHSQRKSFMHWMLRNPEPRVLVVEHFRIYP